MIDPAFDWEDDRPPKTPLHDTVLYELHVKGFTKLHPGVREDLRGTYAGLASDAAIEYLVSLGVTAVELLPIHQIGDERFLHDRGLTNYWGYSTIGFFAPHAQYAATGVHGQQVSEFKGMVKALHRAGLEVILDVVYNHTAEGDHRGPMLAFRGLDNASYYRLEADRRRYTDYTGTGNTLNLAHPSVLRMVTDSLRYWVTECHVDGFRFDLASTLTARVGLPRGDSPGSGALAGQADRRAVGRRPGRLSRRRLPARLERMERPLPRHHARLLARPDERGGVRDALHRLERPVRHPRPLADRVARLHHGPRRFHACRPRLVRAQAQRGEPGGQPRRQQRQPLLELRRRGADGRPEIRALRARQQRNMLATLLLSQGVPMLVAGDERGRTQRGNNNAWCQDNEVSWIDWRARPRPASMLASFTRRVLALRKRHAVFRRTRFLDGGADRVGAAGRLVVPSGRHGRWRSATGRTTICATSACS